MAKRIHTLDKDQPVWDRFFMVAPLVLIGSKDEDGEFNLAPKHMVTPLGWANYFGFVCTPRHRTYENIQREREFSVSFLRPTQVILSSLAAAPRDDDGNKYYASAFDTFPAADIDGILVQDAYLFLECSLLRIYDDFEENSLIAGQVLAAHVAEEYLRINDGDDQEILYQAPLLAYLNPGRYASIQQTYSFPFHEGMKK